MTKDIFEVITDVSVTKTDQRNPFAVMCKTTEEIGELATEIGVHMGYLDASKGGKDGIIGESADAIITIVDQVWLTSQRLGIENPMDLLKELISKKCDKWKNMN